jgi:hypothetical protein
MTRLGPKGRGPRSEKKMRVARERSLTRSDTRRASLTSHSSPSPSKPTASATLLCGTALNVVLSARGRSRFDVSFGEMQIVKSSTQPICEAARVLYRLGYLDDLRVIVWHKGSDHHAISGPLGYWRKVRVREDRRLRYVAWEPRPRRVGAKKGRGKFKGVGHRGEDKNVSTTTPGAAKRNCSASDRRPTPMSNLPSDMRGGTAC